MQASWRCKHRSKDQGRFKKLTDSKTIHGRFTKIEREKAKARAEQGRIIRSELKELEAWFIDHGHLKKNWRKDWA